MVSEKVDVAKELRDCRRKLARVNNKLEGYDSREDNLRDLRRQSNESAERENAMRTKVIQLKKEKDRAENR